MSLFEGTSSAVSSGNLSKQEKINLKSKITINTKLFVYSLLNNEKDNNLDDFYNKDYDLIIDKLKIPILKNIETNDINNEYNKLINDYNNIYKLSDEIILMENNNMTDKIKLDKLNELSKRKLTQFCYAKIKEKYEKNSKIFNDKYELFKDGVKNTKYSYNYLIKSNPTIYLQSFFNINNYLKNDLNGKFQCFPLYKNSINNYITITSSSLLSLFTFDNLKNKYVNDINNKKEVIEKGKIFAKNKKIFEKSITKDKYIIWREYFNIYKDDDIIFKGENKLNYNDLRKLFRIKGYKFHHIKTDGVGVSLVFEKLDYKKSSTIKNDKKSSTIKNNKNDNDKNDNKDIELDANEIDTPYLQKIDDYKKYKLIGIDPNKRDVIFCTDGAYSRRSSPQKGRSMENINGKTKFFRYTKPQINNEILKTKYDKIRNKSRKEVGIELLESDLSQTNPKSNNFDIFCNYVDIKNKVYYETYKYYNYIKKPYEQNNIENVGYLKMRLNTYFNNKRSEENMFKKI